MAVKSKDYFNELKKRHELEESLSVEELEKRSLSVNPNILEASNKTEEAKKYAQMLGAAFDSYVVSWLKPEDYKEGEVSGREYEFSIKTGITSFFDLFENRGLTFLERYLVKSIAAGTVIAKTAISGFEIFHINTNEPTTV